MLQELHLDYIVAAANLKAFMCGLPENRDAAAIKAMVSKVTVPEFKPKSGVKIAVTDAEAQAGGNDSCGRLISSSSCQSHCMIKLFESSLNSNR